MSENDISYGSEESIEIDLRDPLVAAFWAWLWPGAGHFYQGRHAKGLLFMVCILGTFFFGLVLGNGHVVYASWTEHDKRLPYLLQVGVGLPALPALVQSHRVIKRGAEPLFGLDIMAPPHPVDPDHSDSLAEWHKTMPTGFEMGTLYTMIAGLLNILAIYDAFAGPVITPLGSASDKPPPDGDGRGKSNQSD